MITENDLRAAIAECQGERSPNANTCIKMAAYYTLLDNLYPERKEYSYAPPAVIEANVVTYQSDTGFGQMINGKSSDKVWRVMDELMTVIQVLKPNLYDGVMRKLSDI